MNLPDVTNLWRVALEFRFHYIPSKIKVTALFTNEILRWTVSTPMMTGFVLWDLINQHTSDKSSIQFTALIKRQIITHPNPWFNGGWVQPPFNTLRPRQNGRHFPEDIFKCIFVNENIFIPTKSSLKFVPNGSINNIPALVQIMAWCRPGDKPLSEPMMVDLPTHICVARPQWVKLVMDKLSYSTKINCDSTCRPWKVHTTVHPYKNHHFHGPSTVYLPEPMLSASIVQSDWHPWQPHQRSVLIRMISRWPQGDVLGATLLALNKWSASPGERQIFLYGMT